MQVIQPKAALKYVLLPGIGARVRGLFGSGFGYLAFLMATIYGIVRLLPPAHPYLNPQNIGRFGMHHVVVEAANNLVISRKNIDQIVVFTAVITAMALLIIQFLFLLYFLFIGIAHAQGAAAINSGFTGSLFNTPKPQKDIALGFLDRVFGIPNMFCNTGGLCTEISQVNGGIPWPIHRALQDLFEFYSFAMLLVAVLIVLYFVVVVVAETATTGSPFGQRFQNVWVPIRLVVALGLLVPINYGYNTGQYMALYSAKLGSAIATNGWLRFNAIIADRMGDSANPSGHKKEAIVAQPNPPSLAGIVQAMSIVHACAYTHWHDVRVLFPDFPATYHAPGFTEVKPYFVKTPRDWMQDKRSYMEVSAGTTYVEALNFFSNGDIILRFGARDEAVYHKDPGNVGALCGEVRIPVTDISYKGRADEVGGSDYMLRFFFNLVRDMWFEPSAAGGVGNMKAAGIRFAEVLNIDTDLKVSRACGVGCNAESGLPSCAGGVSWERACVTTLPTAEWKDKLIADTKVNFETAIQEAWEKYTKYTTDIRITHEILDLGWGGAAVWYNKIAQVNGAFLAAVIAVPEFPHYPQIMKKVKTLRMKMDSKFTGSNIYSPNLSQDTSSLSARDGGLSGTQVVKAEILAKVYGVWNNDGADTSNPQKQVIQNVFNDAMGMILGLDGLLDIRKKNAGIHPLAQLTMVGKAMVESTIRNLAISSAGSFMGGFLSASGSADAGALASAVGGFFFSTAFLGLTAGVTLYYVLPFLPFIYFFFAVGSWVKGLFEAMVGIPLWALAHLRLDGEGLPGDSASNGYFLILEIALRPILIVFGLVAAILIFTAQVRVLNFIWDLVTDNAAGFSDDSAANLGVSADGKGFQFKRDIVDQFFFTVIYTIMVYMLAMASFKLIDQIPNSILRWMGSGASSYSDNDQNTAEGLGQYVATAGMIQGQQLSTGVQSLSAGAGQTLGGALNPKAAPKAPPAPKA